MTTPVHPRPAHRRLRVAFALGLVAVLAGLGLALAPRSTSPSPSPSTPPSAPLAVADQPPLARDGAIDEGGLAHDSRSDRYRTPFGAVPAGTTVTLRLRATAGDLTDATVRI